MRDDVFRPGDDAPALLLNPGPVNVTARVARALLRGDLCHREPEYDALQQEVRRRLVEVLAPGGDHAAVLLTGSGTAAMEAAVSSLAAPGERLLVCKNGVYGERLEKIARAHGIEHAAVEAASWFDPIDPAAVAAALDRDPGLRAVAVVHHETTTGLLNPVRALAGVCRARGVALIVDAISSIGGEELDLAGWGVDAVIGTANKCIRGLPGVSFVLCRRGLLERAAAWPPRTLYLHLPAYFAEQERGGIPFTPAVQVTYALHEALAELAEEGVAARAASCRALADRLRAGLERLGLALLLPPERRSGTITTVALPNGGAPEQDASGPRGADARSLEGRPTVPARPASGLHRTHHTAADSWTYERLHDALRAEGFVIYAGQGDLRRRAFRVATLGVLDAADVDRLLEVLARLLARTA